MLIPRISLSRPNRCVPLKLLAESGYDQLTIDAVAAWGRCGKATIYRRSCGDADTALVAEISSAVLLSRLRVTCEPLDDAFVQHLVDAVLLPALRWQSPK